MIKRSYVTQMSYDVSSEEKIKAEKALINFSHAIKLLSSASEHLNIMKTPFKENPEMTPEEVMKARAALRRFRDKAVENFNEFKSSAFNCVNIMQTFASDTQSLKLIKSFISGIDDLEKKVNNFVDLFSDLQSKDFAKNTVSAIEDIQKQSEEIEEIIDERIKNHIQSNILASSWVDSVGDEMQMKIEKKTPLILDLSNDREKALSKAIKEKQ